MPQTGRCVLLPPKLYVPKSDLSESPFFGEKKRPWFLNLLVSFLLQVKAGEIVSFDMNFAERHFKRATDALSLARRYEQVRFWKKYGVEGRSVIRAAITDPLSHVAFPAGWLDV